MGRILFIDLNIPEPQRLLSSVRDDVAAVLYDPETDTVDTLLSRLNITEASDVGFVQHGNAAQETYVFLKSLGTAHVGSDLDSWSDLIAFYTRLRTQFGVQTIDLISCCIYTDPNWVAALRELETRCGLNFRASKNATGSLVAGGDWYMESDGVDIRDLYFMATVDSIEGLLLQGLPPQIVRLSYATEIGYNRDRKRLRMSITNSSTPFTCQWSKNGFDISGATAPTYTISRTRYHDAGLYTFTATNAFGTTSLTIELKVYENHGMVHIDNPDRYMVSAENVRYGRITFDTPVNIYSWNLSTSRNLDTSGITWIDPDGYFTKNPDILSRINARFYKAFLVKESSSYTVNSYDSSLGGYIYKGIAIVSAPSTRNIAVLKSNGNVDIITHDGYYQTGFYTDSIKNVQSLTANSGAIAYIKTDGTISAFSITTNPSWWWGGDPSYVPPLTNVLGIIPFSEGFIALTSEGKIEFWGNTNTGYNAYIGTLQNIIMVENIDRGKLIAVSSSGIAYSWYFNSSDIPFTALSGNISGLTNVFSIKKENDYIIALTTDNKYSTIGYNTSNFESYSREKLAIAATRNVLLNNDNTLNNSNLINTITLNSLDIYNSTSSKNLIVFTFDGSVLVYTDDTTITPTLSGDFRMAFVKTEAVNYVYPTYLVEYTVPTPSIISQSTSASLHDGESIILGVDISGIGPYKYQWIKDGNDISGANQSYYQITSYSQSDSGVYNVLISTDNGSILSNAILINTYSPPVILQHPVSYTVYDGSSVEFLIDVSSTTAVSFQWKKNGYNIINSTNRIYTISTVSFNDIGLYSVDISNESAIISSNSATLSVITMQPYSSTIYVIDGSSATLQIDASGAFPLTYQWYKDGTLIFNATSLSYTIPTINSTHNGNYTIVITDAYGSISASIQLVVVYLPTIRSQPASQIINELSPVQFTVDVSGTPSFSYQWNLNGSAIIGATSSIYSISSVDPDDAGSYTVDISNNYGTITSAAATLDVKRPPRILKQPSTIVVYDGSAATLSVDVSGGTPFTYQWRKNGVAIPDASANPFVLLSAQVSDEGTYSVYITNADGGIISNSVKLLVDTIKNLTKESSLMTFSTRDKYMLSAKRPFVEMTPVENPDISFIQLWGNNIYNSQYSSDGWAISISDTSGYSWGYSTSGSYDPKVGYFTKTIGGLGSYDVSGTIAYTRGKIIVGIKSSGIVYEIFAWPNVFFYNNYYKNSQLFRKIPASVAGAVQIVSTGYAHVALKSDGTIVSWGYLENGGNAPTDLSGIHIIAATESAFAAVSVDGRLFAWGEPERGGVAPTDISGIVSITSNLYAFAAISANGSVFAWGDTTRGGLAPSGLTGVVAITPNNHAFAALKSDGSVVSWGNPLYGGTTPSGLTDVIAIERSDSTFYALRANRTVYAWGYTVGISTISNISDVAGIAVCVNEQIGYTILRTDRTISSGPVDTTFVNSNIRDILAVSKGFTYIYTDGTRYDTTSYKNLWTNALSTVASDSAFVHVLEDGTVSNSVSSDLTSPNYVALTNEIVGQVIPITYSTFIALLYKLQPPVILTQPAGIFVLDGSSATFTVDATSAHGLRYQWYKFLSPITGATSATFTIPAARASDATIYSVEVQNAYGYTVKSSYANLTIVYRPRITWQPSSITPIDGARAALSAVVEGTQPLFVQWVKDGADISGATATSYIIASAADIHDGSYYMRCWNAYGDISTNIVSVTVNYTPRIYIQPTSTTFVAGGRLTLTSQAVSTIPLTYQWVRLIRGQPVDVSDQTNRIFDISEAVPDLSGQYYVRISNSKRSINSNTVSVSFSPLSKDSLLSGKYPKNIIYDIPPYIGITKDVVVDTDPNKKKFTFDPMDPEFVKLELASIPAWISYVAAYTSRPTMNVDTGTYQINVGTTLFGSSGQKFSGNFGDNFMILKIIPPFDSDIILQTINIYRNENGSEIYEGVATRQDDGSYTISVNHMTERTAVQQSTPCFVEGTRVLTSRGFVAIEALEEADMIITDDGRAVPFRLSKRIVKNTTTDTAPYIIPADSFCPGAPPATCRLSPTHAFQIAPGLWHFPELAAEYIPAIQQYGIGEPCTYYHIQLPNYFTDNIVLEGGTVAESFGEHLGDFRTLFTLSEECNGFVRVDPDKK